MHFLFSYFVPVDLIPANIIQDPESCAHVQRSVSPFDVPGSENNMVVPLKSGKPVTDKLELPLFRVCYYSAYSEGREWQP